MRRGLRGQRDRGRPAACRVDVLGDIELLAIVVGGRDALAVASRLVAEAGNLPELARVEPGVLPVMPGMTRARAARIQAALELGKRRCVHVSHASPSRVWSAHSGMVLCFTSS